jgi:hypothetical protein
MGVLSHHRRPKLGTGLELPVQKREAPTINSGGLFFNNVWQKLVSRLVIGLLVAVSILGLHFVFSDIQNSSAASVPLILNYQGRLADSGGNLLGGTGTDVDFRFSIWDASTSGSQIWPASTPSTMAVEVKEGVFNVGIGDTTASGDALTIDVFDNDPIYLEVQVYGTSSASWETFTPRQRVQAGAFSIRAATVEALRVSTTSDYTFQVENTDASAVANLQVEGQVVVGTFASDPTAVASGSIVYVAGNLKYWNGSAWQTLTTASGSTTLQSAYDLGNTITATDARDISFTLADTATDPNFIIDIASGAAGVIDFQAGGSSVFQVQPTVVTVNQNFGTTSFTVATSGAVTLVGPITGTGALTVQAGGSSALTLGSTANTAEVQGSSVTIDANGAGTTTITLTNEGAGSANVDIAEGNLNIVAGLLQTAGVTRLTNTGVLQNIASLTGSDSLAIFASGSSASISLTPGASGQVQVSSGNLNIISGALQLATTTRITNAGGGIFTSLDVSGNATTGSLIVTGTVDLQSTLDVTGLSTLGKMPH